MLNVILKFLSPASSRDEPAFHEIADLDLVQLYQKTGNTTIVCVLMERYNEFIVGMSLNHLKDDDDVKDFTQELFIKLCDKLRTNLISNFKSWLLTCVRNLLIDSHRKAKTESKRWNDLVSDQREATDTPFEDAAEDEKYLEQLAGALQTLNENERTCVAALYLENKSYHEIMEAHSFTFNQVRGYRDRGIKKLKDTLTRKNEIN